VSGEPATALERADRIRQLEMAERGALIVAVAMLGATGILLGMERVVPTAPLSPGIFGGLLGAISAALLAFIFRADAAHWRKP
jgi:hypothetical protein